MRIAVCIAEADPASDGAEHLDRAARYAEEARDEGATLLVLPETFPGPWRTPVEPGALEGLCGISSKTDIYIAGGYLEPVATGSDSCYNTVSLCAPDGTEHGRYRRVAPSHTPWTYRGGALWDFDWVRGRSLPVFDIDGVTVGILVCSEVYVPELARVLALQGAELLLYPTGVLRPASELFETWRVAARARAIDNLAAVALCSNSTPITGPGYAMICEPETELYSSSKTGVHVVDIDIERLRWLRDEQDRVKEKRPWRVKPGLNRDWRPADVLRQYGDILLDGQDFQTLRGSAERPGTL